jgi:hypothetical protein
LCHVAAAPGVTGAANNGCGQQQREPAKPGRCPSERKAKRSKRENMGGDGIEPPTSWV